MNTDLTPHRIIEATILAFGLLLLGLFIKLGIDDFANKDRKVTVKGLAEQEVPADKVTWPITMKETGNSLPELYDRVAAKEQTVRHFLRQNGIAATDITSNAPKVVDLQAQEYGDNNRPYRYIVTSSLTVTSKNVSLVRQLIARQGELLKQGVAIVGNEYDNSGGVSYEYVAFQKMKPKMMQEAIANAQKTAEQFAENSHSKLNKIVSADQGQFSIDDRDATTPYIKKVRVVTTITYSLKD